MKRVIKKVIILVLIVVPLLYVGVQLIRVYRYDYFVISGESMYPTLYNGDVVMVDKGIVGARIYSDLSNLTVRFPATHRNEGRRTVDYNDIVIVNNPQSYGDSLIGFRIGDVLSKRVVGLGGDTISIKRGYYVNSSYVGELGYIPEQDFVNSTYFNDTANQDSLATNWEYASLYIPKAGDKVVLDSVNIVHYKGLIYYETGLSSKEIFDLKEYSFKNNYYFVVGDNFTRSLDSRGFGLIPESFVVGVVTKILYSRNPTTNNFRRGRTMIDVNRYVEN